MAVAALAITAAVLAAATTASAAVQAKENALAQEQAFETQAEIARENAKIVSQQGAAREDLIRRRNREIISKQRAGAAESGIDPGAGSPVDVLEQSQVESELEVLTSRYQDELKRRNLALEAEFSDEQASRSRAAGNRALTTGLIGAGSKLLSGFGQARGFSSGTSNPTVVTQPGTRGLGAMRVSRPGGIGGV